MLRNILLLLPTLLLLSTSLLFLLFLILPGSTPSTPFDKTYFLRADTSNITGSRPLSQWTYFYICGPHNVDCTPAHPAIPFGYAWAPRADNVPPELIGPLGRHTTSHTYFYLWRFGWVFLLMTLFFDVCAFFAGWFAACGTRACTLAFVASATALFWYSLAAALTTATFVKARDRFLHAHRPARIGPWSFGFLWGGYVALLISTLLLAIMRNPRSDPKPKAAGGRRVKEEYS